MSAQDIQHDGEVHGHALQNAADQIPSGGGGGDAQESAAGVRVPPRRALPHEVGQKDQPISAERALRRLGVDERVGGDALLPGLSELVRAYGVSKPAVGGSGGLHGAVGGVEAGNGVTPGDGAHVRIKNGGLGGGGDPGGGAHAAVGSPGGDGAGAHIGGDAVPRADDHGGAGAQPGEGRGLRRDAPCHMDGGKRRGQLPGVDARAADDPLRPGAGIDVEAGHAVGVGVVRAENPGEPEHQIVLGVEDLMGFGVDLRLVIPDPHQLLQTVRRGVPMAGDVIKLLLGDGALQLVGLCLGAGVRPDDGGAERNAAAVHTQTAHHLTAEGDGGNAFGVDAGLADEGGGVFTKGAPPVLWVLLRPVLIEIVDRVGGDLAADEAAVLGEKGGLVPGGAQIVGQEIVHMHAPFWKAPC